MSSVQGRDESVCTFSDFGNVQTGSFDPAKQPSALSEYSSQPLGRILIAGTRSGSGKTTVTVAIIAALKARGFPIAAFKCGPDYIDPMFLSAALEVPARNLDPYFSTRDALRHTVAESGTSLAVIEGVMGYYDGLGSTTRASTFDVAAATETPVILVLDPSGMAASAAALLQGFIQYRTPSHLTAVILNNTTQGTYSLVEPLIRAAGLIPLGYLPRLESVTWPTRHLGLTTATEIPTLSASIAALASAAEDHLDLDSLLRCASTALALPFPGDEGLAEPGLSRCLAPAFAFMTEEPSPCHSLSIHKLAENPQVSLSALRPRPAGGYPTDGGREIPSGFPFRVRWGGIPPRQAANPETTIWVERTDSRIAIANDESFCFVYAETIQLLKDLGAEIVYFSPTHDPHIPDADALYLPGGYPELHAETLSANLTMRNDIKSWVQGGVPTIAECGGFMYLLDDIDGYPMAGAIPGSATITNHLQHFGYAALTAASDNMLLRKGETMPVHEFHYADSTSNGRAFSAAKASTGEVYLCGHATDTLYAGFPHLYLPAFPQAAVRFLERARLHREARP